MNNYIKSVNKNTTLANDNDNDNDNENNNNIPCATELTNIPHVIALPYEEISFPYSYSNLSHPNEYPYSYSKLSHPNEYPYTTNDEIVTNNSDEIKKLTKSSDSIYYTNNEIKKAIKNNTPIEDKLHVIIVISNPCLYKRRYELLHQFVNRFEDEEPDVLLYIVEMAYGNQTFQVTEKNNKRHLQLRTTTPLWHKENMINLGVNYLLPSNYKAFAWIDADIEFDSPTWAMDTLKILHGHKDMVQLFSHAVNMDKTENTLGICSGFGYNYCKKRSQFYPKGTFDYWHCGYAWAITRKAYEQLDGLYENAILGAGDYIMALAMIQKCDLSYSFNTDVMNYEKKAINLRLGYVPGVIRHYYHGSHKNRKYVERTFILRNHKFNPYIHLTKDTVGILIPTNHFSQEFKYDIFKYFSERKEDD